MSSHRAGPEESSLIAVSLAPYRIIAAIGGGSFEISESEVYEDEFKNEFKRSSKDARGRLGTLDDET